MSYTRNAEAKVPTRRRVKLFIQRKSEESKSRIQEKAKDEKRSEKANDKIHILVLTNGVGVLGNLKRIKIITRMKRATGISEQKLE